MFNGRMKGTMSNKVGSKKKKGGKKSKASSQKEKHEISKEERLQLMKDFNEAWKTENYKECHSISSALVDADPSTHSYLLRTRASFQLGNAPDVLQDVQQVLQHCSPGTTAKARALMYKGCAHFELYKQANESVRNTQDKLNFRSFRSHSSLHLSSASQVMEEAVALDPAVTKLEPFSSYYNLCRKENTRTSTLAELIARDQLARQSRTSAPTSSARGAPAQQQSSASLLAPRRGRTEELASSASKELSFAECVELKYRMVMLLARIPRNLLDTQHMDGWKTVFCDLRRLGEFSQRVLRLESLVLPAAQRDTWVLESGDWSKGVQCAESSASLLLSLEVVHASLRPGINLNADVAVAVSQVVRELRSVGDTGASAHPGESQLLSERLMRDTLEAVAPSHLGAEQLAVDYLRALFKEGDCEAIVRVVGRMEAGGVRSPEALEFRRMALHRLGRDEAPPRAASGLPHRPATDELSSVPAAVVARHEEMAKSFTMECINQAAAMAGEGSGDPQGKKKRAKRRGRKASTLNVAKSPRLELADGGIRLRLVLQKDESDLQELWAGLSAGEQESCLVVNGEDFKTLCTKFSLPISIQNHLNSVQFANVEAYRNRGEYVRPAPPADGGELGPTGAGSNKMSSFWTGFVSRVDEALRVMEILRGTYGKPPLSAAQLTSDTRQALFSSWDPLYATGTQWMTSALTLEEVVWTIVAVTNPGAMRPAYASPECFLPLSGRYTGARSKVNEADPGATEAQPFEPSHCEKRYIVPFRNRKTQAHPDEHNPRALGLVVDQLCANYCHAGKASQLLGECACPSDCGARANVDMPEGWSTCLLRREDATWTPPLGHHLSNVLGPKAATVGDCLEHSLRTKNPKVGLSVAGRSSPLEGLADLEGQHLAHEDEQPAKAEGEQGGLERIMLQGTYLEDLRNWWNEAEARQPKHLLENELSQHLKSFLDMQNRYWMLDVFRKSLEDLGMLRRLVNKGMQYPVPDDKVQLELPAVWFRLLGLLDSLPAPPPASGTLLDVLLGDSRPQPPSLAPRQALAAQLRPLLRAFQEHLGKVRAVDEQIDRVTQRHASLAPAHPEVRYCEEKLRRLNSRRGILAVSLEQFLRERPVPVPERLLTRLAEEVLVGYPDPAASEAEVWGLQAVLGLFPLADSQVNTVLWKREQLDALAEDERLRVLAFQGGCRRFEAAGACASPLWPRQLGPDDPQQRAQQCRVFALLAANALSLGERALDLGAAARVPSRFGRLSGAPAATGKTAPTAGFADRFAEWLRWHTRRLFRYVRGEVGERYSSPHREPPGEEGISGVNHWLVCERTQARNVLEQMRTQTISVAFRMAKRLHVGYQLLFAVVGRSAREKLSLLAATKRWEATAQQLIMEEDKSNRERESKKAKRSKKANLMPKKSVAADVEKSVLVKKVVDKEDGSVKQVVVGQEDGSVKQVVVGQEDGSRKKVVVDKDDGSGKQVVVGKEDGSRKQVVVDQEDGSRKQVVVDKGDGSVKQVVVDQEYSSVKQVVVDQEDSSVKQVVDENKEVSIKPEQHLSLDATDKVATHIHTEEKLLQGSHKESSESSQKSEVKENGVNSNHQVESEWTVVEKRKNGPKTNSANNNRRAKSDSRDDGCDAITSAKVQTAKKKKKKAQSNKKKDKKEVPQVSLGSDEKREQVSAILSDSSEVWPHLQPKDAMIGQGMGSSPKSTKKQLKSKTSTRLSTGKKDKIAGQTKNKHVGSLNDDDNPVQRKMFENERNAIDRGKGTSADKRHKRQGGEAGEINGTPSSQTNSAQRTVTKDSGVTSNSDAKEPTKASREVEPGHEVLKENLKYKGGHLVVGGSSQDLLPASRKEDVGVSVVNESEIGSSTKQQVTSEVTETVDENSTKQQITSEVTETVDGSSTKQQVTSEVTETVGGSSTKQQVTSEVTETVDENSTKQQFTSEVTEITDENSTKQQITSEATGINGSSSTENHANEIVGDHTPQQPQQQTPHHDVNTVPILPANAGMRGEGNMPRSGPFPPPPLAYRGVPQYPPPPVPVPHFRTHMHPYPPRHLSPPPAYHPPPRAPYPHAPPFNHLAPQYMHHRHPPEAHFQQWATRPPARAAGQVNHVAPERTTVREQGRQADNAEPLVKDREEGESGSGQGALETSSSGLPVDGALEAEQERNFGSRASSPQETHSGQKGDSQSLGECSSDRRDGVSTKPPSDRATEQQVADANGNHCLENTGDARTRERGDLEGKLNLQETVQSEAVMHQATGGSQGNSENSDSEPPPGGNDTPGHPAQHDGSVRQLNQRHMPGASAQNGYTGRIMYSEEPAPRPQISHGHHPPPMMHPHYVHQQYPPPPPPVQYHGYPTMPYGHPPRHHHYPPPHMHPPMHPQQLQPRLPPPRHPQQQQQGIPPTHPNDSGGQQQMKSGNICSFFRKGTCRYGPGCRDLHV